MILDDIRLALKQSSEALNVVGNVAYLKWRPEYTGLPVLYLYGDTAGMNKDNEVVLSYMYDGKNGELTCKWQGSSSLSYPKKNYTIKFNEAFEVKSGWGDQKKYCLKANYIDASHARNVISATLWGEVVKSREEVDSRLNALPNGGAIDGFPILLYINDIYQGLYTWNIPKDKWMFGMGDSDSEAIICAEKHSDGTNFRSEVLVDGSDFELEYAPDDSNTAWIAESVNRLINACNASDEALIGQYVDIQSAIDYYIFECFVNGLDIYDKNYLLATYDGVKWFFSAYDLDTTYGNHWAGKEYYTHKQMSFADVARSHKLMNWILTNKKAELISRYKELRNDILSESNLLLKFSNFICQIPQAAYAMESVIWPMMPGTMTNNISQIMNHMRLRLEWLDAEIDNL